MSRKKITPAVAYLRTSSAANVGPDKDSDKRQRDAIARFAKAAGFEIVGEFYDEAVSGADPVDVRPGFAGMLERIAGNGVRTIIVETANRFARDLIVQETGHRMLRDLGVELIAADSPDSFVDDTPTAVMVRQILGAVAQFEKAALVAKLKGARARPPRAGQVRGAKVTRRGLARGRGDGEAAAPRQPQDGQAHEPAQDQRRAGRRRALERARAAVSRAIDPRHGAECKSC